VLGRVRRRLGLPLPGGEDPGPYLGTPAELVPALLEMAGVGSADYVFDLGCGDGRIVVEAARSIGCRARGVEQDAELAERARRSVETASLGELAEIQRGDLLDVDYTNASVLFLFLPLRRVARLLPNLRQRLRPGARILVHEQAPLLPGLEPDASRPLIGRCSLTIAHLWSVE
jgi:SAM-dependent methyltransferase